MITREQRNVALLVAGCLFMEILDGTIVVTATPSLAADFGVPRGATGIVVSAYLITLAVLIPLSGWLAARWGARRVLLTAIVIFTLASLGCALGTSLGALVATRVLQAVGGAMMVPVARLVALAGTPRRDLMRLISFIVWPALVAPAVAPLLGGVITTYTSWRGIFLINLPLGLVAFVVARRLIRPSATSRPPRLDRWGVVLTCAALGGVTYAGQLLSAPEPPWERAGVVTVASAALLAVAIRHLLRAPAPLVNLRTMAIHTFGAATTSAAVYWLVVGATPFLLPLVFQDVFGWSAVKSGALVMFLFVGNIAIKPATTPLYGRFGFRAVLLVATACLAVATACAALITAATPLVVIAVIALASGAARSVGFTGYSTLAFSDVPDSLLADANTLSATTNQLFAGLGVTSAMVALRVGSALEDALPAGSVLGRDYTVAFLLLAVIALATTVLAARLHPTAGDALRRRSAAAH